MQTPIENETQSTKISPTQWLNVPSPAKLNLFLHILGRREDNYHNLQTAFQILDFGDTLSLTCTSDNKITLKTNVPKLDTPDNLILQAARALHNLLPKEQAFGAEITLNKILPTGGGIGGGSSNAATTLVALNSLWQVNLSLDTLAEIGESLGADVPVFVQGRSAWAEGVGEKLEPINLPQTWYLVLTPDCHVSTATIFCHKNLTRDSAPITVAAFLDRGGRNDCQSLVETLFPQVRSAVIWLNQFAKAQLTGTGACVFAAFDTKKKAEHVLMQIPDHLSGFVAKGVNVSPLHNSLP